MIKVHRLAKAFGRTEAIKDLSFTVRPGEVLGLLGPNGAGKTTAMRALAGVLVPDSGQITVGGHDIKEAGVEAKKLVAYLPDQSAYFAHLTCWEHVCFVGKIYEVDDFQRKAEALFERFQLTEKKNAFATELSKGMRQRLGLISAFLHSPSYVLFDEPMNGLDPVGIRTLNEMIREQAAKGVAFIISSHLLSLLESICTNVLVIQKGECRLTGTMEEVQSRMRTLKKETSLEEVYLFATQEKDAA